MEKLYFGLMKHGIFPTHPSPLPTPHHSPFLMDLDFRVKKKKKLRIRNGGDALRLIERKIYRLFENL